MGWREECLKCTKCPRLSHRPVLGEGPKDPRLVLIGEAPGATEDEQGKPFVGSSGRVLNMALQRAGISRTQVYVTNIVKCRPPGNDTPTEKEVHNCLPFLIAELDELGTFGCLVPMGNTALRACIKRWDMADITTYRGSPTFSNTLMNTGADCGKVLPTLHPAYIMRQWLYGEVLANDLKKAWKYGEDPIYTPPQKDYLLPTDPGAEQYINEILRTGCAADIETTSLKPWDGTILGIAFSNKGGTGIFFPLPTYREEVQRILESPAPKVFQFGTFDVFYLDWHGYKTVGYNFDTKFAQNILCPELPASLAFLNSLYTMYPYYKTWKGKEIRKDPGSVPQQVLAEYCTQDADTTWQVYQHLERELELEEMGSLMSSRIMPLTHVLMGMRKRGIRVSNERLEEFSKALRPKIQTIAMLFEGLNVNINSPRQVGELLERNGIYLPRTKTGQPKTDQDSLDDVLKKHPTNDVVKLLMEYRELNKLYTTYIQGIREHRVGERLHTELVIGGTATGRLSSRDPNLQNVPKSLRKIFLPEPNELIVEADYQQMELRVAAALAQDHAFMADLAHGVDVPNKLGATLGWDMEKCKAQRVVLKAVLYGSLFGRTARSIAIEFGIPTYQAQAMIDSIVSNYPSLHDMLNRQKALAQQQRYLRSAFGRKRFFLEPNVSTQAFNFPIQSAAADVALGSLIMLDKLLPNMLRLTVHDSIILSCPPERVDEVAQIMQEVMERPIPEISNYRFPTVIEVGPSWGELSRWTKPESQN